MLKDVEDAGIITEDERFSTFKLNLLPKEFLKDNKRKKGSYNG